MLSALRQSEGWSRYLSSQGWKVEEVEGAKAYIRKLPFYGSVIKIQRPSVIPPVETIDEIAKRYSALFVNLEPLSTTNYELLTSHGFIRDPAPNLPTKNTVVDLTKTEEELWKILSQDTRHDIKEAEEHPVSVAAYQPEDKKFDRALESFSRLLSETGRRQGFWAPHLNHLKTKAEAFSRNAILLLAYPPPSDRWVTAAPGHPVAGFLILTHDGIAYYHHTATSVAGRKLNAAYLLMWETIRKVKSLGMRALNLGSIYDPRYHKGTKKWQDFSTFKKKWRGHKVEYPQPLIKYYSPIAKLLFKLA